MCMQRIILLIYGCNIEIMCHFIHEKLTAEDEVELFYESQKHHVTDNHGAARSP